MSEEELEPLARALPTARAERRRRFDPVWLVPLAALAAAAWLALRARAERGPEVVLRAAAGHGLGPGDPVRYRGIDVGEVLSAEVADDRTGVVVRARLARGAEDLAVEGSRFWIVRPHLALDEVGGLETVFGARYVEVLPGPGDGAPRLEFSCLEEPPVAAELEPGGLEVVLLAARRGGLRPGAPIHYRGMSVGRVLSLGLASDGADVEVRAWISPAHRRLVRSDSRFFEESGVSVELGLSGLAVGLQSLRSLLVGSVGLATPTSPGPEAATGQRFRLASEPEPEWLEWRPALPVGSDLLPPDGPAPRPLRALLAWTDEKLFLSRSKSRAGWVLQLGDALLGPADLLEPAELSGGKELALEVAGERIPLAAGGARLASGAALAPAPRTLGIPWPPERVRRPAVPEDCLAVGDPAAPPLALAAQRLTAGDGGWQVERGRAVDDGWHGAPAFARADGALVGVLLVEGARARIAPVP